MATVGINAKLPCIREIALPVCYIANSYTGQYGAMAEEERKEATIIIRVKPSVKAKAVKRAKQEARSLANYLERLIEQDAEAADRPKPRR
jgi:hypothetical protein